MHKLWVRSALETPNPGFRKINRMTPILTGDLLLTGNSIDGVAAWDRETGSLLWRLKAINGVEGGATLIRNRLFFGASDGQFYAVDAKSGHVLWTIPVKAETLSEPLLDPQTGIIYTLTAANTVYAIEADSGKTVWVYSRQDVSNFAIRGGTRPALRGGTLYVGFSDGYLAALSSKNGQVQWDVQLNKNKRFHDIDASPLIDGDRLYIASFDDKIYCLSADHGDILWRVDGGGYGGLTLRGNSLFYPTSEGEVRALDKTNGKIKWTTKVSEGVATTLVPYKGLLAYGESRGFLKFIDTQSGKIVGQFEPGRGVFSAPAVDEKAGRVYFISNESNVYALSAGWTLRNAFPWLEPEGPQQ